MSIRLYKWTVNGTGSDNTWSVQGETKASPSEFPQLFDRIMREVFTRLTQGKAIYGQPGVGGCRGPYDVISILIIREASVLDGSEPLN